MSIELNNTENEEMIEVVIIQDCQICQEPMSSFVTLDCGHNHCLMCHTNFIKNDIKSCAFCRKGIESINNCVEYINNIKVERILTENDQGYRNLIKCKLCSKWFCTFILLIIVLLIIKKDSDCQTEK